MRVEELMTKDVASCRSNESMEQAARAFWERDCGCIPVTDEGNKVRGILTDRDLAMAVYTSGRSLNSLPVEHAMSQGVLCTRTTDDLDVALRSLSDGRVHRLPVIDAENHLVGMLSFADILQALSADSKARRKYSEAVLDALIEVTRPRSTAQATTQARKKGASRVPELHA